MKRVAIAAGMYLRALLIITLCLAVTEACTGRALSHGSQAAHYIFPPRVYGNHRLAVTRVGMGFSCVTDGTVAPAIYLAEDVGHRGMPRLRRADIKTLRDILNFARPARLRFTFVGGRFIVFNAPGKPSSICNPDTPPFAIWNGACNDYYNAFLGTIESVMDCDHPPRPWVKHDNGRGTGSWANIVH